MTRSLYAPRPSPYYIYALDYRRNSAGIRVMHALCDALIRSGYEAYALANVCNPALMTPRLTTEVINLHRQQGVEPIVVYPEVVGGNPLEGNVVVRYLLNRPGFLNVVGDGEFAADDIIYAYTKDLQMPGEPDDQVMFMPPFDMSVFRMSEDVGKRVPGKICYYQGRGAQASIDPALLAENSVEITPTFPASWEEMADLFQTCEYFYCTESSALAGEAALCGCVSVVLPNEWAPHVIGMSESKGLGVAWGLEPEQLEWARKTLPLFRERMIQQETEFWKALDSFIDVTQRRVIEFKAKPKVSDVTRWLAPRVLDQPQRQLVNAYTQAHSVPSIEFVVVDELGEPDKLRQTVASINGLEGIIDARISIRVLTIDPLLLLPQDNLVTLPVFTGGDGVQRLNDALIASSAQWFMLLEAGDELTSSGLLVMALHLAGATDHRAVYADEVMRLDNDGQVLLLRPDMNLDLLLSCPASMARHWLFQRDTWEAMGGFATQYPDSFELEYILRLIETNGLEGLAHVAEPLLIGAVLNLCDSPQDRQVIERHLHKRGFENAKLRVHVPGCYAVDYGHVHAPSVSILIVIDGHLAEAQRCIESLLSNTRYDNYEMLLLDRGNDDPLIRSWLSGVEELGVDHLRVLRFSAEDTAQMIRNQATGEARGEFLLFLDSAIGVIGEDWLQQLLNHAVRPEVGCVGAKLVGGDGTVHHAGLVLGLGGPAGVPGKGMTADAAGYMQRLDVDQNYAALSGKCLMISHEHFQAVGGFDEQLEPWSDVDLCLKLHQAGYLNVWTPRVRLLLSESEVVPPTFDQDTAIYQRWLPLMARDPSYNPNCSLAKNSAFRPADTALTWRPLAGWKPLPVVLVHPARKTASGIQRIVEPLSAMRTAGLIEGVESSRLLSVVELERFDPDVIVLQRQLETADVHAMLRMKQFSRAFKVYDVDAYLPGLPEYTRRRHSEDQVLQAMGNVASCMDRLIVSNDLLAQVFEGLISDIKVRPARLDPAAWLGLSSQRRCSRRPRVGWVGGQSQAGDLGMIANVIKDLAAEVEWVFLGSCPEELKAYAHEVHKEVTLASYPAKLASLNLDLAVVPLEDTLFNRCKSNQRLLEYAMCGVPVICSDLEAFQGDLPVTRVKNTYDGWIKALRAYLADLDSVALLGDAFHAQVQRDWMMDRASIQSWSSVWLPD